MNSQDFLNYQPFTILLLLVLWHYQNILRSSSVVHEDNVSSFSSQYCCPPFPLPLPVSASDRDKGQMSWWHLSWWQVSWWHLRLGNDCSVRTGQWSASVWQHINLKQGPQGCDPREIITSQAYSEHSGLTGFCFLNNVTLGWWLYKNWISLDFRFLRIFLLKLLTLCKVVERTANGILSSSQLCEKT